MLFTNFNIAFEPFRFENSYEYFAPYYFKKDGGINFTYIGGENYKYFSWDWYRIPKEKKSPQWTEPFFDKDAGDIIMSTYSAPFYKETKGKKEFLGVVTADISLSGLTEILASLKITPTGFAFLIFKNGTFIFHPQVNFIMNETIFTLAKKLDDSSLKNIGIQMVNGNIDALTNTSLIPGQKSWVFFHPITTNGWSMSVVIPENDVFADMHGITNRVTLISTIGLVFLLICVIWISRSITKPIRVLSNVTDEIAVGNLDVPIPAIKTSDEIGRLVDSYIHMRDNMKKYIEEVIHLTADKERMESELNFAAQVQQGFLPQEHPKYLNYEFGAVTVPAKFVGGNFYDLIPLQKGHLALALGDFSGKGVSQLFTWRNS
jgi:sigma-B regulation protein RsbU (phosphoserine phosphatase)